MSDFVNAKKALIATAFAGTESDTLVYTPSGSKDCVVLSVSICNISATDTKVDVALKDSSATTNIAKDVVVPGNSTLELMAGQKYVIKNTEKLIARAEAASRLELLMNGLEQT